MGKRIKSTGVILDASSMASAPVSPAGTVALRAKSDSTQFQYSANGGAWTDFGSGGGGGTVRLDQVLDPIDPIVTPTAGVKAFAMGSNQLAFTYTGAEAEDCMVIQSATDAPGSGSVLLLRTLGASTTKLPLRIEGRGAFYFSVGVDGKVAIGAESGLVHKLNVYHTNSGGTNVGILHASSALGAGNTAVTISNAEIRLDDTGNTTALLAMTNLALDLDRDSSSVANSSLVCTNISASSNINANTLTVRNLSLSIQVHNSATVTNWEAIRITAPGTFGGGVLTNKRAIITEAGAGNVGFGTLTPSAQLHVSGTVQLDLGSDARGDVFYRSSAGTLSRLGVGTANQVLTTTDIGSGVLEPRWAAAGAGSGTPATPFSTLQYNNAGAFGAVTSSVVTGANLQLGGTLTLSAATALTHIIEKTTHVATATEVGRILFRGDRSGVMTDFGIIRAYWDDTSSNNAIIEIGKSSTAYFGVSNVVTHMQFGSHYVQIQAGGIIVSTGTNGGVFYQTAGSLVSTVAGTTSQYLKGGTVPSWGSLDAEHITSGTLALANGGTNSALTDPNADRIMFWDDSAGVVDWLTAGSGLTITGTTITAAGGPATPASTLQYNNAGAFGAVTSSVVSGANIELGGSLTLNNTNRTIVASAVSAGSVGIILTEYAGTSSLPINLRFDKSRGTLASPTDIATLDEVGFIQFRGRRGGAFAQQAYIRTEWTSSAQGTIEIGAGTTSATSFLRLTANSGLTLQGTGSNQFLQFTTATTTLQHASSQNVTINSSGYRFLLTNGNFQDIYNAYFGTYTNTTFSSSIIQSHVKSLDYTTGATLAGFGTREIFQLKSSTTAGRLAAATDVRWQDPTDATRSAVMSLRTVHKGGTEARERMVLGGYKDLAEFTLTDLFRITFLTTDQLVAGGEIHLLFVGKQVAGSVQTAIYRRKMNFVIGHNGATNTGIIDIREDTSARANASTTVFNEFYHALNADAAPGSTLATAITKNGDGLWETLTYRISADSALTTPILSLYFHIIYHGEIDITLL